MAGVILASKGERGGKKWQFFPKWVNMNQPEYPQHCVTWCQTENIMPTKRKD